MFQVVVKPWELIFCILDYAKIDFGEID
jgi:hypothetical protein